ncbi:MAG TPA: glycosyltransferase [Bellilinea sp.]|nr:glycosyltransferase [Bellilinea sp.]
MLPISVIVPARNAEHLIEACLTSIFKANPAEVIVVDGLSTDKTREIAQRFPVVIISDGGLGVPAARMMGVRAANNLTVGLFDVDINLPDGALEKLLQEFIEGQYDALQAGLISHSGPGFWGQALANHHNNGRSRRWPGLMASLFKKQVLLDNPLDERFRSGEDIEIRWRLKNAGYKMGVSHSTIVQHWFDDTYEFAKDQWQQDGKGLGRMVVKYGLQALPLLGIPVAGALRGTLISLVRLQPKWIRYYIVYFIYNYSSIFSGLFERVAKPEVWMQSQVR